MVETTAVRLPGGELLDVGDDGLVVAVTERRVLLHDVLVGDALRREEVAQDLVGGARVDVVGAEQHPALGAAALLAHQVLDRRDRLLVRRRARVEDVVRRLLALVLHRVEEQAVQLLEHRQHRLARHRGPAAERRRRPSASGSARAPSRRTAASSRPGRRRPARACGPSTPPFSLISSIVISATSLSDVSLIAIVPDSECRMPTLIGPLSSAGAAARRGRRRRRARARPLPVSGRPTRAASARDGNQRATQMLAHVHPSPVQCWWST